MRRQVRRHGPSQHERTMRDLARKDQGALAPLEMRTVREQTERQLDRELKKAGGILNVEEVMALVFEGATKTARTFLSAMLMAFDRDIDELDIERLYLIADAWDYFPHRFLQGRCPAELDIALFKDVLAATKRP